MSTLVMNNASKTTVIAANEPWWLMMQDDNPTAFRENTKRNLFSSILSYWFFPPLCVLLNLPRPFLTTWWSVYCQAIWSVMLFTPLLSQKKKKKIYDKIWWLTQVVCFTGLLVLWVRTAVCVCVCVATVCNGVFTRGPALQCCDAECHRPEPCSHRNQLWSWQVCLLRSPTTLFPSFHTNVHVMKHIHKNKKNTHSFMACGLSTHALTTSPHIHTYPPTITQAAGSLSHASYKHTAKSNSLAELCCMVATHSTHPSDLFQMRKHDTISCFYASLLCRRHISQYFTLVGCIKLLKWKVLAS